MVTKQLRDSAVEQVKQELINRSKVKSKRKDEKTKREQTWAENFMNKKAGDIK